MIDGRKQSHAKYFIKKDNLVTCSGQIQANCAAQNSTQSFLKFEVCCVRRDF